MFCLIQIILLVILVRNVHCGPIGETTTTLQTPPPPTTTTITLPVTFTVPITQKVSKFTFDGVYYDDETEYIQEETARLFKSNMVHCGIGEYFRCVLRTPYMHYICVATMGLSGYYTNMYSFCEFEYRNCINYDTSFSNTNNAYDFGRNVYEVVGDGTKCDKGKGYRRSLFIPKARYSDDSNKYNDDKSSLDFNDMEEK